MTYLSLFSANTYAFDTVKVESPLSPTDQRTHYKNALIKAALDETKKMYGGYHLITDGPVIDRERAKTLIQTGNLINCYITSTSEEWESIATPIFIPIRKGLAGYRLLLVHKTESQRFDHVNTLDDLRQFKMGSFGLGMITQIFSANAIPLERSDKFDSLFFMLNGKRSDFVARGIHEIFKEMRADPDLFVNLEIEPRLAIYSFMPTYLFVSPAYPDLAKRLNTGMHRILENGIFDQLFWEFHGRDIKQANMSTRKIIDLTNPLLPKSTPIHNKKLWLDMNTMKKDI